MGEPRTRPRIGLIVLSAVADDPRVRRQGDVFHQAGWDVIAFGLPGARSGPPVWPVISLGASSSSKMTASDVAGGMADADAQGLRQTRHRIRAALNSFAFYRHIKPGIGFAFNVAYSLLRRLRNLGFRLFPYGREKLYWKLNHNFQALYELARQERVDVWLANDWTAVPIAQRLAREQGVHFGYDTHELAVEEYADRLSWRLLHRPLIRAVEGSAVRQAKVVSCVSHGISEMMAKVYDLASPPIIIRNIPRFQEMAFKPTGDTIRVLYHGLVSPGRGLEECIASVPLWAGDRTFTIRGPASPDYVAQLQALARAHGVEHRVHLAPPVQMTELVAQANAFDVGLFVLPLNKHQNTYVLPNKLFEYIMAGLCVCVSQAPEMASIVREHEVGLLIDSLEPAAIANVINRLTPSMIDQYKHQSLKAARTLNWEHEGQRFVQLYQALVPQKSLSVEEPVHSPLVNPLAKQASSL